MTVNVLILEDNPVARGLLSRVVRESFIDAQVITETGDAQSARRHIAAGQQSSGQVGQAPFKLLLLDLDLPRHQGLALLDELAHDPAVKIVTALYDDDEQLFPALQRGAEGYLLKEAHFAVLVEELQRIVRGQPSLSPALARRLLAHFRERGSAHTAKSPTPTSLGRLSEREAEVLTGLSKGLTVKEIASHLGTDAAPVYACIRSIYRQVKANGCGASEATP